MKKSISIILFLSLTCILGMQAMAQKPNLKFKSIKSSDGLVNNTVQAIFEDSYGFIWLGTHHGLQRYDGKTFVTFTSEENDSTGLSHNFINSLCEDDSGNIWIATSIGLNKYSRIKDRVSHYKWYSENNEAYDQIGVLKVIHDDANPGTLWMTTIESQLIMLNTKTEKVVTYKLPKGEFPWVLSSINSEQFQNHLLVGTTDLFLFDKISGEFSSIYSLEQTSKANNNRFNDLVFDPSNPNVIWCATGDLWGRGTLGGVLKLNLVSNEHKLFTMLNRPKEIPDLHILSICFSSSDKLWVGTRNYGVLLYDMNQDRFFNYQYNEYDEGSFVTENAIRSMHLDRSGTLWFGTWGDGISILSPALQKFTHYKHLPNVKGGLPDSWITSITEDKNGYIWIGTNSGGLSKFDPKSKTFENHFSEFGTPENPIQITYVFYDSRENLWIGTYANALYRYNPETGKYIHYSKGISPKSVSQKRISTIVELIPGEILISTYGGGLNIYNYDSDSFVHYLNDPSDNTSIPDNQIWLPFLGNNGYYYMGGNSKAGLIRFDPSSETFSEILSRPDFNTFMNSVKDSKGNIYIDAMSYGFSELLLEDSVYIRPLVDKWGHRIIGAESAVIDNQDNIWVGTTKGLVKFNLNTNALTTYNPDDGLQGYNFFRFAAYAASSGELYFGGLNGLNTFNPEEISLSKYEPPVVITGFKLFQNELPIGDESPLKKNILLTDIIELSYNENDFSISFSGLDYANPHKIQYKYQLVNHDEDWIDAGTNSSVGYTNMDPDKYEFLVKSTNADGIWNEKTTSLEIIIHPPWWQTNIAYFSYALIFIFGVFGVDRYQRRRLKEKERARNREKELQQAKEIEKAYTKLKATQNQLVHAEKMASLGELTAGIAHEIQNPLNFVNNFAEVSADLIEELQEEIEEGDTKEVKAIAADIQENLNKINHHGQRASNIVKGMLEHSRSGSSEKIPTDMNILADEYLRLAYHGLRAKNKSFNADFKMIPDAKLPHLNIVPQDIGRVLLNLINNAFYAVSEKASQNIENYKPQVVVSTAQIGNRIEIRVKDNGNGIPEQVKEKIFQPFFTTKPTGQGTGLGLSMSYDIIAKGHGGELKVETTPGKGTEFIIELQTN